MKVAFTTSDLVHINAHFGWAKQIAVYDVTPEGYTYLDTIAFGGDLKEDGNEDKLIPKLAAVADCKLVYVSAIGGSAAARLIRQNITPVKANSTQEEIEETLHRLVATLKGNPPPWLRKALRQESKIIDAFADELAEQE